MTEEDRRIPAEEFGVVGVDDDSDEGKEIRELLGIAGRPSSEGDKATAEHIIVYPWTHAPGVTEDSEFQ